MIRARLLCPLSVVLVAATSASAQTTLPFAIKAQQGTIVTNVSDGGSIAFTADGLGRPADANITITHLGVAPSPGATPTGTATITAIDLSGSTDFSLTGVPDPAQTFQTNQSFTIGVRYRPTTSVKATGLLKITYTETAPTPPSGVAPKPTTGSFTLNLSGVAPEFVFSYLPPPNTNVIPLAPNDTILFPLTAVNDTPTAAVVITNRGSGPGVVSGIAVSGAAFTALSLPAAFTSVDAGKDLRFSIRYSPLQIETSAGSVRIDFVDRSVTFGLSGTSAGAVFAYDALQSSGAAAVLPGQTISVPDTPLSTPTSIVIRVRNTGNADGKIASIDVTGAGFTLTELPFVPLTLPAGGSFTFTLNFNPPQAGPITGRLRIGADTFTVTGNGLGQNLVYAYVAGGVTSTVVNNAAVIFPPVPVGQTSTLTFQITNNGTSVGSINSISIGSTPATAVAVFTLSRLPALPVSIPAGGSVTFTATFSPTVVGNVNGVLRVDTVSFPVAAVGNTPAALPNYQFTGASGAQEPAQQVAAGITLAAAYPLNLNGTLTLAFNSDVFSNDPAVQFATGGRTVTFVIPAGATQAVFPNNSNQIRLQTGTVAGTITLTPSFLTDGGINMTPTIPPALNISVAQSVPRILSVQVSNKTSNTLTLLVTGFATGRGITQIDLQFTPVAGETLGTSKVSLNVDSTFNAWFQSSASTPFGSQFTATLPFTLAGDVKNVATIVEALQSVSVTLINRQGTSAARSVDLK